MTEPSVKELLEGAMYPVHDVEEVRRVMKKPKHTSQETYDNFTRLTAETGALWLPFKDHPEVKKILEEGDD